MLRRTPCLISFLLLMGVCTSAWAQSGTIIGSVIDAQSRRPIADLVVTATSSNLQG